MHTGVMTEISDTVLEENSAGDEGPAVLSLGLLSTMSGVTFDGNDFYCEEGEYSTDTEASSSGSRAVRLSLELSKNAVAFRFRESFLGGHSLFFL